MSKSVTIGTIRKVDGEKSVLMLSKGITILKDGVEVPLNEYRSLSLFKSDDSAKKLASLGYLTDEELDKKLSFIKEKNISRDVVAFKK